MTRVSYCDVRRFSPRGLRGAAGSAAANSVDGMGICARSRARFSVATPAAIFAFLAVFQPHSGAVPEAWHSRPCCGATIGRKAAGTGPGCPRLMPASRAIWHRRKSDRPSRSGITNCNDCAGEYCRYVEEVRPSDVELSSWQRVRRHFACIPCFWTVSRGSRCGLRWTRK